MSKLLGGIMMGAGILISSVSGICALVFVEEVSTNPEMIYPIIRLGLIPFLIGLGLFFGGRRIRRRAMEAPPPLQPPQPPQDQI
jgi:F0F1-type ATP synthase membrane subunit c/vacuolar-type H+-ATPase subunit K